MAWNGEGDAPTGEGNQGAFTNALASVPEGGYKTLDVNGNPTFAAAPDFNEMLNHALVHYQESNGPLNRPWDADADISAFGNQFLQQAQSAASQWNVISGQNISSPWASINDLPTSVYANSRPAENKGSNSPFGQAVDFAKDVGTHFVIPAALAYGGAAGLGAGAGALGLGGDAAAAGADVAGGAAYGPAELGEVTSANFSQLPGAVQSALLPSSATTFAGTLPPELTEAFASAGITPGVASSFLMPPGSENFAPVQEGPSVPGTGPGGSVPGTASPFSLQSFLQNPVGSVSRLFGGGDTSGGSSPGGLFGNNPLSSALSVGSGIYGLYQQNELRKKALEAMKLSDPWGTSGGRAGADAQLQALLRDPTGAAQNDPAYKLRIQAAQRANGAYGQGSGRMAVAAADASTDWYNTRLAQLGGLAGAGLNPANAAQVGLGGMESANTLAGQSLASIGYGVGGGGTGIPPAMQQQLMQRIMQMATRA